MHLNKYSHSMISSIDFGVGQTISLDDNNNILTMMYGESSKVTVRWVRIHPLQIKELDRAAYFRGSIIVRDGESRFEAVDGIWKLSLDAAPPIV